MIGIRCVSRLNRDVVESVNRRFDLALPADLLADDAATLLERSFHIEVMTREAIADRELDDDHEHARLQACAATIPAPLRVRSATLVLMTQLDDERRGDRTPRGERSPACARWLRDDWRAKITTR